MATVEQQVPQQTPGATEVASGIPVENPATGEIVATVASVVGRTGQPDEP